MIKRAKQVRNTRCSPLSGGEQVDDIFDGCVVR
jgi:hypothetical protein